MSHGLHRIRSRGRRTGKRSLLRMFQERSGFNPTQSVNHSAGREELYLMGRGDTSRHEPRVLTKLSPRHPQNSEKRGVIIFRVYVSYPKVQLSADFVLPKSGLCRTLKFRSHVAWRGDKNGIKPLCVFFFTPSHRTSKVRFPLVGSHEQSIKPSKNHVLLCFAGCCYPSG